MDLDSLDDLYDEITMTILARDSTDMPVDMTGGSHDEKPKLRPANAFKKQHNRHHARLEHDKMRADIHTRAEQKRRKLKRSELLSDKEMEKRRPDAEQKFNDKQKENTCSEKALGQTSLAPPD